MVLQPFPGFADLPHRPLRDRVAAAHLRAPRLPRFRGSAARPGPGVGLRLLSHRGDGPLLRGPGQCGPARRGGLGDHRGPAHRRGGGGPHHRQRPQGAGGAARCARGRRTGHGLPRHGLPALLRPARGLPLRGSRRGGGRLRRGDAARCSWPTATPRCTRSIGSVLEQARGLGLQAVSPATQVVHLRLHRLPPAHAGGGAGGRRRGVPRDAGTPHRQPRGEGDPQGAG